MQRQSQPAQRYHFNLNRFYRIWFSNQPDQYLGIENELRFIRMRAQNKDKAISFLYSASALSSAALTKMKKFCETHKLNPVDFDTEIMPLLEHNYDKDLYLIARTELMHALRHKGGNLAAASDCLRLIVPVIEKYGIYSDFDVELNFNQQPHTLIKASSPMLLNGEVDVMNNGMVTAFLTNSDFLAFASDELNLDKLSDAALIHIRGLQKIIIDKYKHPFTLQTLMHNDEIATAGFSPGIFYVFDIFSRLPDKKSVYRFRKFVEEYDYPGAPHDIKTQLQYTLTLCSVTRISGPCIFWSSYMSERPDNDRFTYGSVPSQHQAYQKYIALSKGSCVGKHKDLSSCVKLTNTPTETKKYKDKPAEIGVLADLSWTITGAEHKVKREDKMLKAAKAIQFFARKFCSENHAHTPSERNMKLK